LDGDLDVDAEHPGEDSGGQFGGEGERAFTPDAATLHATSLHVPLQHYPVNPSYAATWICAHTGTTLSRAQWHTYIPDASYRGVCPASG
jgi:hypothetical protein